MADNVKIEEAVSGTDIAADEISGAKYQRVKLIHGADGVNDGDVSTNNPLPVTEENSGDIKTSVELIDDAIKTDDAAFTPATDKVMMAGFQADETSTDSVNEGDAGAARMTLDRKQINTLYPSSGATDGLSIFRTLDLDESEEDVKQSAGNLYGYYFANTASSARYLKFYNNTASNVTVGTTTPVLTFYLPKESAGHIAFPYPISFSTAICVAATTGVADNDTGAPGANEVILNVFYK